MTAGSEPISVWGNTTPSFMSYSSSIIGSRRVVHPHRRSGRTIMPLSRRVKVGQVGYCVGMALWLLKSEPDEWSWTEQVAKGRAGAGVLLPHRQGARDRRDRQGDRGGASGFDRLRLERRRRRRDAAAPDAGRPRPDQGEQTPRQHGAGQARAPVGPAGYRSRVADRLPDGRTRLNTPKAAQHLLQRPAERRNQDTKIPRGTVMDTTQFGTSTISLILRSPATLQMAYASCRLRP